MPRPSDDTEPSEESPGLRPLLLRELSEEEREALKRRWLAMSRGPAEPARVLEERHG